MPSPYRPLFQLFNLLLQLFPLFIFHGMPLNLYSKWTHAHTSLLWQLSAEKKPLHEMAAFFGRPEKEILEKSSELGIVFKSEYDPLQELVDEYLKELDEQILKASGA